LEPLLAHPHRDCVDAGLRELPRIALPLLRLRSALHRNAALPDALDHSAVGDVRFAADFENTTGSILATLGSHVVSSATILRPLNAAMKTEPARSINRCANIAAKESSVIASGDAPGKMHRERPSAVLSGSASYAHRLDSALR
jgi:hypothetical protein